MIFRLIVLILMRIVKPWNESFNEESSADQYYPMSPSTDDLETETQIDQNYSMEYHNQHIYQTILEILKTPPQPIQSPPKEPKKDPLGIDSDENLTIKVTLPKKQNKAKKSKKPKKAKKPVLKRPKKRKRSNKFKKRKKGFGVPKSTKTPKESNFGNFDTKTIKTVGLSSSANATNISNNETTNNQTMFAMASRQIENFWLIDSKLRKTGKCSATQWEFYTWMKRLQRLIKRSRVIERIPNPEKADLMDQLNDSADHEGYFPLSFYGNFSSKSRAVLKASSRQSVPKEVHPGLDSDEEWNEEIDVVPLRSDKTNHTSVYDDEDFFHYQMPSSYNITELGSMDHVFHKMLSFECFAQNVSLNEFLEIRSFLATNSKGAMLDMYPFDVGATPWILANGNKVSVKVVNVLRNPLSKDAKDLAKSGKKLNETDFKNEWSDYLLTKYRLLALIDQMRFVRLLNYFPIAEDFIYDVPVRKTVNNSKDMTPNEIKKIKKQEKKKEKEKTKNNSSVGNNQNNNNQISTNKNSDANKQHNVATTSHTISTNKNSDANKQHNVAATSHTISKTKATNPNNMNNQTMNDTALTNNTSANDTLEEDMVEDPDEFRRFSIDQNKLKHAAQRTLPLMSQNTYFELTPLKAPPVLYPVCGALPTLPITKSLVMSLFPMVNFTRVMEDITELNQTWSPKMVKKRLTDEDMNSDGDRFEIIRRRSVVQKKSTNSKQNRTQSKNKPKNGTIRRELSHDVIESENNKKIKMNMLHDNTKFQENGNIRKELFQNIMKITNKNVIDNIYAGKTINEKKNRNTEKLKTLDEKINEKKNRNAENQNRQNEFRRNSRILTEKDRLRNVDSSDEQNQKRPNEFNRHLLKNAEKKRNKNKNNQKSSSHPKGPANNKSSSGLQNSSGDTQSTKASVSTFSNATKSSTNTTDRTNRTKGNETAGKVSFESMRPLYKDLFLQSISECSLEQLIIRNDHLSMDRWFPTTTEDTPSHPNANYKVTRLFDFDDAFVRSQLDQVDSKNKARPSPDSEYHGRIPHDFDVTGIRLPGYDSPKPSVIAGCRFQQFSKESYLNCSNSVTLIAKHNLTEKDTCVCRPTQLDLFDLNTTNRTNQSSSNDKNLNTTNRATNGRNLNRLERSNYFENHLNGGNGSVHNRISIRKLHHDGHLIKNELKTSDSNDDPKFADRYLQSNSSKLSEKTQNGLLFDCSCVLNVTGVIGQYNCTKITEFRPSEKEFQSDDGDKPVDSNCLIQILTNLELSVTCEPVEILKQKLEPSDKERKTKVYSKTLELLNRKSPEENNSKVYSKTLELLSRKSSDQNNSKIYSKTLELLNRKSPEENNSKVYSRAFELLNGKSHVENNSKVYSKTLELLGGKKSDDLNRGFYSKNLHSLTGKREMNEENKNHDLISSEEINLGNNSDDAKIIPKENIKKKDTSITEIQLQNRFINISNRKIANRNPLVNKKEQRKLKAHIIEKVKYSQKNINNNKSKSRDPIRSEGKENFEPSEITQNKNLSKNKRKTKSSNKEKSTPSSDEDLGRESDSKTKKKRRKLKSKKKSESKNKKEEKESRPKKSRMEISRLYRFREVVLDAERKRFDLSSSLIGRRAQIDFQFPRYLKSYLFVERSSYWIFSVYRYYEPFEQHLFTQMSPDELSSCMYSLTMNVYKLHLMRLVVVTPSVEFLANLGKNKNATFVLLRELPGLMPMNLTDYQRVYKPVDERRFRQQKSFVKFADRFSAPEVLNLTQTNNLDSYFAKNINDTHCFGPEVDFFALGMTLLRVAGLSSFFAEDNAYFQQKCYTRKCYVDMRMDIEEDAAETFGYQEGDDFEKICNAANGKKAFKQYVMYRLGMRMMAFRPAKRVDLFEALKELHYLKFTDDETVFDDVDDADWDFSKRKFPPKPGFFEYVAGKIRRMAKRGGLLAMAQGLAGALMSMAPVPLPSLPELKEKIKKAVPKMLLPDERRDRKLQNVLSDESLHGLLTRAYEKYGVPFEGGNLGVTEKKYELPSREHLIEFFKNEFEEAHPNWTH